MEEEFPKRSSRGASGRSAGGEWSFMASFVNQLRKYAIWANLTDLGKFFLGVPSVVVERLNFVGIKPWAQVRQINHVGDGLVGTHFQDPLCEVLNESSLVCRDLKRELLNNREHVL